LRTEQVTFSDIASEISTGRSASVNFLRVPVVAPAGSGFRMGVGMRSQVAAGQSGNRIK